MAHRVVRERVDRLLQVHNVYFQGIDEEFSRWRCAQGRRKGPGLVSLHCLSSDGSGSEPKAEVRNLRVDKFHKWQIAVK
jgi:hypothetical protein